ncbi:MAG: hypothetical protein Q9221_005826 [Calogaya cf. arnoldii]
MSKKPASIFAGGWTAQKAAVLNSTKLPDKTRCKACHKLKAIGNFSNKQQLDFRHRLAGPYAEKLRSPISETIVCKACTPGPISELTCCLCGFPKSLDEFSKNQRKDPDNARCLLCVNAHLTEGWAHVDQKEEEIEDDSDDSEDLDTRSTTNPYSSASYRPGSEVASATSGLRALNLSEHDKWNLPEKKKSTTVASESDLLGSYTESVKGKGKQKENVHGGYHGSPSIAGSERSVNIITDGTRSGFARPPKGGNPGFANPPPGAPQRHPNDIIEHLKVKEAGRVVSYNDDDDTASDDSFGML